MIRTLLIGTLALAAGMPAHAAEPDPLFHALGGTAGITAVYEQFVTRVKADPRIGHQFKDVRSSHLVKQLSTFTCVTLQGPCSYDGETMKKSHAELGITRADFNALVEVLQDALDAEAVPFPVQRELLARLAPMHREIITRP